MTTLNQTLDFITNLDSENKELKAENAKLQARVAELEAQLAEARKAPTAIDNVQAILNEFYGTAPTVEEPITEAPVEESIEEHVEPVESVESSVESSTPDGDEAPGFDEFEDEEELGLGFSKKEEESTPAPTDGKLKFFRTKQTLKPKMYREIVEEARERYTEVTDQDEADFIIAYGAGFEELDNAYNVMIAGERLTFKGKYFG